MTETEINDKLNEFAEQGKIEPHHIGPFSGILLKLQGLGMDIGKVILAPIALVDGAVKEVKSGV